MQRNKCLYTGKAKSVYSTDDNDYVILEFRDDTTAFNGEKMAQLTDKGKVNNQFNAFIMRYLADHGIANHFVKSLSPTESLVKHLKMLPIECVIRNRVAGGLSRRLGIEEGMELQEPILEFFLKNDALNDPMINESHIRVFGWASDAEVATMKCLTLKVNDILTPLFAQAGLLLVDYKLEFGYFHDQLLLGDEFSPDGCRIWDSKTHDKLDKDRFRRDLGNVIESYKQVATRLGIDIH